MSPEDVLETSNVDDSEAESSANRSVKLYKISDASGSLQIKEVSGMPLTQDMLDNNAIAGEGDCFVLDTGRSGEDAWSGIFVWIGKNATKAEKVQSIKSAEEFLAKNGLPKWTKIVRIAEGCETTMFKQYFKTWKDPEDAIGFGNTYHAGTTAEW